MVGSGSKMRSTSTHGQGSSVSGAPEAHAVHVKPLLQARQLASASVHGLHEPALT